MGKLKEMAVKSPENWRTKEKKLFEGRNREQGKICILVAGPKVCRL